MANQTPAARLAAAWHKAFHNTRREDIDGCKYDHEVTDRILAADPTLAADLALAAAVRRLHVKHDDWYCECGLMDCKTLAAIEEALHDE